MAGSKSGKDCTRYTLLGFSAIFLIAGIAILGVGISTKIKDGAFQKLLSEVNLTGTVGHLQSVGYGTIGFGAFVIVLSLIGYFAAKTENRCLLFVNIALILLYAIIALAAGAVVIIFQHVVLNLNNAQVNNTVNNGLTEAETTLYNGLLQAWQALVADSTTDAHTALCDIFQQFSCSGFDLSHPAVSGACSGCVGAAASTATCLENCPSSCPNAFATTPCLSPILDNVGTIMHTVGYALLGVGLFLLVALTMNCCLCCGQRKEASTVDENGLYVPLSGNRR